MKLFLFALIIIGFAIAGIAIKMFFIKGAEFKKSCSSTAKNDESGQGCICGGAEDDSSCEYYEEHHGKKE